MARIRTIKPEFPQSETIGRLSRDARLLFIQLWTVVDDSGRTRGNSRILASLLYPYDDIPASQMDSWIGELETEKCLVRYEVDGATYIQILNWLKHQKIDKPTPSKLPEFDGNSRGFARIREFPSAEGIVPVPVSVPVPDISPIASGVSHEPSDAECEVIYLAYPRKVGKGDALHAIRKAVKHLGTGQDMPRLEKPEALSFLLRRVGDFRASPAGNAEEHTPYPATWFNKRRYLDDDSEWHKGGQDGQRTGNKISTKSEQSLDATRTFLARRARELGIEQTGDPQTIAATH